MQTSTATISPPGPEAIEEVERLLDELGSRSPARRSEAERALAAMGPKAGIVLQALLEPELQSKRAWRRPLRWLPSLALFTFLAFVVSLAVRFHMTALLFAPLILLTVIAFLLVSRDRLPRKSRLQIEALAALDDKRLLPFLLDLRLVAAGYPEDRKLAARIARLFASLEPGDRALLSDERLYQLNDALQLAAGTDSAYFVAILKGLGQVGDHTSLPVVARLAAADPRSAVTQAARECLPRLNARAALTGHHLLRPAAATESAGDLLRSADDRSILLRATEPAEDGGA